MEGQETTLSIPIEEDWEGDYRIEYDGKYITLFGKTSRYPAYNMGYGMGQDTHVLIPCVLERRGLSPYIQEVTDTHITLSLYHD